MTAWARSFSKRELFHPPSVGTVAHSWEVSARCLSRDQSTGYYVWWAWPKSSSGRDIFHGEFEILNPRSSQRWIPDLAIYCGFWCIFVVKQVVRYIPATIWSYHHQPKNAYVTTAYSRQTEVCHTQSGALPNWWLLISSGEIFLFVRNCCGVMINLMYFMLYFFASLTAASGELIDSFIFNSLTHSSVLCFFCCCCIAALYYLKRADDGWTDGKEIQSLNCCYVLYTNYTRLC